MRSGRIARLIGHGTADSLERKKAALTRERRQILRRLREVEALSALLSGRELVLKP